MNDPTVKILVCYHKPAVLVENEVFVPIHAGRAQRGFSKDGIIAGANRQWLLDHMIGDDTGENISEKTLTYSELTALYWAWKNYDALGNPDYIGLMHYRRFLAFQPEERLYKGRVYVDYLSDRFIAERLNTHKIRRDIGKHDIYLYWYKLKEGDTEWKNTLGRWPDEMRLLFEKLRKKAPDIYDIVKESMTRNWGNRCNIFVMKKELFFEYCSFLFPLLHELESELQLKDQYYCLYTRIYGRIAETALNIWAYYKEKKYGCRLNHLPIYYIKDTSLKQELSPAFAERNVPIICACDEKYALPCGVMLQSIIAHASPEHHYDVVVLDNGLKAESIDKLKSLAPPPATNFSLRFYKMQPHMLDKKFATQGHRSATAYCKLFVPSIFKNYDKILYLDADTVVMADVAQLYNTEPGDAWLGAAQDYAHMARLRIKPPYSTRLAMPHLGLDDAIYQYFNAGVMLLNLAQLREAGAEAAWLTTAESNAFDNMEQDVLNLHCKGHVHHIDTAWNVPHSVGILKKHQWKIPAMCYKKWLTADRAEPKLIHYTSSDKPWENPAADMAHHWWHYARQTPFYEEIVYKYLKAAATKQAKKLIAAHGDNYAPADIVRDITRRTRLRLLAIWYRLRALTTFGKLRQHYQKKKLDIQNRLAKIKDFIEGS